jgi:hypothetical protein
MKIVKKIPFKKAVNINRFDLLKKKIDKLIKNNEDSPISKKGNISKLNYFLVIKYEDISEKINIEKAFPNSDLFLLSSQEDSDKFMSHIKKKNEEPYYFKKLGFLKDIVGCFIVATTKRNSKNIDIISESNSISCKLDIQSLPEDFSEMCDEYEKDNLPTIENTKKLNNKSSDIINNEEYFEDLIISILKSNKTIDPPFQELNYSFDMDYYDNDFFTTENVENIMEINLEKIHDIDFLNDIMESAIESENFEFCAKIKDRIEILKNN